MLGTVWTSVLAYQQILNSLLCGTGFFDGCNGIFPYSHEEGQPVKTNDPLMLHDLVLACAVFRLAGLGNSHRFEQRFLKETGFFATISFIHKMILPITPRTTNSAGI